MRQELSVSQRQSHLSNMGVMQWYSRMALSGAKASPEELLVVSSVESKPAPLETQFASKDLLKSLKEQGDASQSSAVASNSAASGISDKLDNLEGKRPPAVEQRALVSERVVAPVEMGVSSECEKLSAIGVFSVNCYLSSDFIVISECTSQSGVRCELQLLANIFKSFNQLKVACSEIEYYQSFNWPVFHSLNLQSTQSNELNEAVKLWLNDISKSQKYIFYFGESQVALQVLIQEFFSDMKLYAFKYSLQDLLQIPTRKKNVWLQLNKYSFQ